MINNKNYIITAYLFMLFLILTSCDVAASSEFPYQSSINLAIIFQFIIILLADILLGGGCLLAGIFLLYKGLTGNAIVVIEINSIKATIINCTPGMFLVMAGVLILYFNKFNVRLGVSKKEKNSVVKVLLIIFTILFIITALGLCIFGAYKADINNIEWLEKIA